MSETVVNCHAGLRYQVRVLVPDGEDLVAPALGAVTGITLRLSATETGAAIHTNVNGLAATEDATDPGLFYVDVTKALHETHVLPLGLRVPFYAIWSKTGDFDMETRRFLVGDRTKL